MAQARNRGIGRWLVTGRPTLLNLPPGSAVKPGDADFAVDAVHRLLVQ